MMSNQSDNIPQKKAGGMPSINPALAMRVMALYGKIDKTLAKLKLPQSERKKAEQNLMEAIAAELMFKLGSKMSDEEKAKLTSLTGDGKVEPNLADIAGFFRDSFEQEELLNDLAESTENVLNEFVKEMGVS